MAQGLVFVMGSMRSLILGLHNSRAPDIALSSMSPLVGVMLVQLYIEQGEAHGGCGTVYIAHFDAIVAAFLTELTLMMRGTLSPRLDCSVEPHVRQTLWTKDVSYTIVFVPAPPLPSAGAIVVPSVLPLLAQTAATTPTCTTCFSRVCGPSGERWTTS